MIIIKMQPSGPNESMHGKDNMANISIIIHSGATIYGDAIGRRINLTINRQMIIMGTNMITNE